MLYNLFFVLFSRTEKDENLIISHDYDNFLKGFSFFHGNWEKI